jgi:hemoglobin
MTARHKPSLHPRGSRKIGYMPNFEDILPVEPAQRHALADRANIAALIDAFYSRVRADDLLGPVFERTLDGRWEQHQPKMVDFWVGLVLGEKRYQGNLKSVHQALPDLTPAHFDRWLGLFLDTVETRYAPAAAVGFMEPALRIAHSLQLSRFGWDFKLAPAQRELLEQINPRRLREREVEPRSSRTATVPALPPESK